METPLHVPLNPARKNLRIEAKIYSFFFVAFAGVVILGLVTFDSTRNLMATDRSVAHALQVRDSLGELLSAVLEAENGRRGYLLTSDFQYQLQFEAGAAQIRPDVKKIALLTSDESGQQKRIAVLTAATEKTISNRTIATVALGSGFLAVIVFLAIGLIHRDLSERRQGEESLAKERAFLDLAIASLPGTFCLFDRYGKLLRWNLNLETVSGYSPDEIREMTPPDFFAEEGRPSVQEAIQRVLKEGASNIEGEMLSKDARRRHYIFSARRILVDGKACVIGAGIDMTEHKLAEKKIHEQANLLELARDAIFVRNLEEKIQYWNRGAEGLYGWTADEAVGGDFAKMAYEGGRGHITG